MQASCYRCSKDINEGNTYRCAACGQDDLCQECSAATEKRFPIKDMFKFVFGFALGCLIGHYIVSFVTHYANLR